MGLRLANVGGRAVLVVGDHFYDIHDLSGGELGPDPGDAIAAGVKLHELAAAVEQAEPTGELADVVLGPPVAAPRHVFGVGLNYRSHAAETGSELPTVPMIFTKFPGCLTGPTGDIVLASETTDYEAELVVVIGSQAKDVAPEHAWDVVGGLTVGQDVSDRALQFATKPPQFSLGKSHDTYGPIGPFVVSPDLLPDRDDLHVRGEINDEVRQDASTADLIFPVPELVAYLSAVLTLYPGDLIFTGTPAGVGRPQGKFLRSGDVVRTTIDGIGTLTNRCV